MYRPSRERWAELCQRAEQAIYWLNTPDGAFYLDVWSIAVYPACTCSIWCILYHLLPPDGLNAYVWSQSVCCVIIQLKAFEQSEDHHHRWLLNMADAIIQEWAKKAPHNAPRTRLSALPDLLRSTGMDDPSASSFLHDLFASGPSTTSAAANYDSTSELLLPDETMLDFSCLDPMWFEQV